MGGYVLKTKTRYDCTYDKHIAPIVRNIRQETDQISNDSYFEKLVSEGNAQKINEAVDFTNLIHEIFFKHVWTDMEVIGEKLDEYHIDPRSTFRITVAGHKIKFDDEKKRQILESKTVSLSSNCRKFIN